MKSAPPAAVSWACVISAIIVGTQRKVRAGWRGVQWCWQEHLFRLNDGVVEGVPGAGEAEEGRGGRRERERPEVVKGGLAIHRA